MATSVENDTRETCPQSSPETTFTFIPVYHKFYVFAYNLKIQFDSPNGQLSMLDSYQS